MAAQLAVEIGGPPSLFPPAEPAAASRICAASRHLHRHYRMRRKRRAARRRPPSGGPQFNVKTLGTRVYEQLNSCSSEKTATSRKTQPSQLNRPSLSLPQRSVVAYVGRVVARGKRRGTEVFP